MTFVARQEQMARIEDITQRALRGQMQIVLLTGEAGSGKTTLLNAFLEQTQRLHPEVFALCSECLAPHGTRPDPYSPFIQLLDGIIGGKKSNARWDMVRQSLLDVAPDWLQSFPGSMGTAIVRAVSRWPDDKIENADQQRRMIQFANALRLASHTSPLILVIDNLQWCDQNSLELLGYIAGQIPITPIQFILLYRPSEITGRVGSEANPVRRTINQVKRQTRVTEVEVTDFNLAAVCEWLEASGCAFPDPFIQRLHKQSQGNPLFLAEYLKLLKSQLLVVRENGRLVLAEDEDRLEIPIKVKEVITRRLRQTAGDLRDLLSHDMALADLVAAQVLSDPAGSTPEPRILKYLNQLEEDYRLVRDLEDQQLVVQTGTEYRFVHALLQQVLYQDLSEGQRRLLHQVIARLMEDLSESPSDQRPTILASHHELGGNIPKAIANYLKAGRDSIARQALPEALELSRKAITLARHLLLTDRRAASGLVDALLQSAEILFWQGNYDSALVSLQEGNNLAEQYALYEMRAHFSYWKARAQRGLGQIGDSITSAQQALEVLGEHGDPHLRGLVHAYLGGVSDTLPIETLTGHLDVALRIAETNRLPDVKVKALLEMAGLAMYRTDRPSDALIYARQAARTAGEAKMYPEQVTAYRNIAFASLRLGQVEEALSNDQRAVEIARQNNLTIALHLALFSLAISWSSGMENLPKGLETLHEALDVAERNRINPSRNVYGAQFNIAFALGRWDEAHQAAEGFARSAEAGYPRGLGYRMRMAGHELLARGEYGEAAAAYRQAIALYQQHSPDERDVRTVEPYLGWAMIEAGHDLAARPLLESVCDFWKGRQPSRYARALCFLSTHFLRRGNSDQAISLLRQALVAIEKITSDLPWPVRPQVSLTLARALLMAGEKEEALSHAQWAYDCYKRMGHFLSGESAFWLGKVYEGFNKPALSDRFYQEARLRWTDLGLEHLLKRL